MKYWKKYIFIGTILIATGGYYALSADRSYSPDISEAVILPEAPQDEVPQDTGKIRFPVAPIIPNEYEELIQSYPLDLQTPQNLNPQFQYNPLTNRYELRSKIGDMDIVTPLTLTQDEYLKYSMQQSMDSYFREKYTEEFTAAGEKKDDVLSMFDFNFDLGPAEKLFGPGGVKLNASGSALIKMGFTNTKNGNPTLSERQRNKTTFDFDTQVQANIDATVGDKINFGLNYNTESTFDFDTKKLKLAYAGKEDEIIKTLEAGNVSMSTTNSLIRGGTALFGIKTELQFGKLTVAAVFSQQESQARTTSSKGNKQTTSFEIKADEYDNNKHFLLGHYFFDNYDSSLRSLPLIRSGISIDKIEVWKTNKQSNFDQARNIVAFIDLGETEEHIYNKDLIKENSGESGDFPFNRRNNLYATLTAGSLEGARDINQVNQVLEGAGFVNATDYEKIGSARLLTSSEYSYNSQLGYLSLRSELQSDEVLAVAYSYTYNGNTYQVGEFSTDNASNTSQTLYVKLLKGTVSSPDYKTWKLMMKNVYNLTNGSQLSNDDFRLDIKHQNDTLGTYLTYITEDTITNIPLLRVLNLDRLDSRNNPYPDGLFDYVEGVTVSSNNGNIIFTSIEPFGSYLESKFKNEDTAQKYVFQELYDSTLTVAQQTAEKNKFILSGEYKGGSSSNISLSGFNVAKGSVTVTANGVRLRENIDYTVDYTSGNVTIINPVYENATIDVSSEDQSGFGMQRKTMMGLNLNYAFNPKFNIGATIMNLSEMPTTMKVQPGMESVNNTIFGFNLNYAAQSQALTNLLDKLPLLDLTAPSQISINAEYAQLIPGHYKSEYGGDYSYIDDFENAKKTIDLLSPYSWALSSTPSMFAESKRINNVEYGNNRALLAWYYIDGIFTRRSSLTPNHIKNDNAQLSNHYVREILESELYPNKDITFNQSSSIPVLNLAYYPKERGPYNVDAVGMGTDGYLLNPEKRWGGVTRRIESGQTDFEAQNIETIEFWLLDPFIYNSNSTAGGDLYINLGEISEDVLKDEKKFFENGLPLDGDLSKVDSTAWGYVPNQQSLNYAFDNSEGARRIQDVGLNGLSTEQEFSFSTYADYIRELEAKLTPEALQRMREDQFSPLNDPAGDNYHYFRGSDYDDVDMPILGRYKRFNGTEGNSADSNDSPESYNTAARLSPDVEDINQDYTLNETEKYYQYRISLRPEDLVVGQNHIVQKMEVKPSVKETDPEHETVTWYQFIIPIKDLNAIDNTIGGIKDFKTIRFMRMFMTNFSDSTILRFGSFRLVHGDWRLYTQNPDNSSSIEGSEANLVMSTVNIEESGSKEPVNYIMPPGVNRILDPGQTQLRQQNEQALSLKITDLEPGEARAIYKSSGMDMRQYRRLQMYTHAEKLVDDLSDLQDNELSIFIRLGSDYKNNYYEYEIPLSLTAPGRYNQSITADRERVWPETNMFDFAFELLTDLKLERNKERHQGNSDVTFYTPYSNYDPDKPMNKMTVLGNPSISEVKVIMVGIRNNSRTRKSAEVWVNELRLTEFNEDGGWAGNANVFLGLSDLGSVNFAGRKETAGFGGIDDGIMDRNMDDTHNINISTQIQLGKFFPEKAKVSIPLHYSYREEVVSPKYNPLDQDILLQDALDAVETKAEKDSIKSFAVDKITAKTLDLNNVRLDIQSKKPMPYDPANFTFSYSSSDGNKQNATTEYERETEKRLNVSYNYSPQIKPWQPFKNINSQNKDDANAGSNAANARSNTNRGGTTTNRGGGNRFLQDIEIRYLPNNISFNSDISRKYYELQLRDVGSIGGENVIPVSFSEDFYWNRVASIQWNLTKNLNMNFTTNTNAQIESPHVQVNKRLDKDSYELWKDSVMQSLRDFGNPLEYNQTFTATYTVPFRSIPALNFMSANLRFNSTYKWERGATLADEEEEEYELGNTIRNNRVLGLENVNFNLENLYNKSEFLSEVNKKYTMSQSSLQSNRSAASTGRNTRRNTEQTAAQEKKNKKFEQDITLNPDSSTIINHQLDNKRVRVTARRADGKIYEVKFKSIDKNSIRINTKDTVNLKISISQLPPLEELQWYKIAQGTARFLMMVRTVGFSYNETSGTMLPNFSPGIGGFNGQGSTSSGYAPGFDFAFGLTGEEYIQKALDNDWLIKNSETNITPAIFTKSETFNFTATLEPFTDFKINLTGVRTKSNQTQLYFMYEDMQRKYSGDFRMTTIGLKSIFEMSDASSGYESKTFNQFLKNRDIIAARLENAYTGTYYPSSGFLAGNSLANTPYNPEIGSVERNSSDVLIPAFLAAYTGKNASKIGLTAFPSLSSILPNWSISYGGLIQLPFIQKHFKSFRLEHKYDCTYSVGAFSSFLSWVPANADGLGYIQSVTENPIPSSPYDITAVSLLEAFNPLFGINSVFQNNASLKLHYNMTNNVNLNMSSYQIIEVSKREFVFGLGYRFENFNRVLKLKKTGGANFNNELNVSANISYSRMHNLIRKIEDNLTQAQSGDSQTVLKLSADYKMSRLITMQAYFDKQISNPLVSATAYPVSTSSFGISCRINLSR